MKNFYCRCGQQVFFDSTACVRCGLELGFDAEALTMVSLDASQQDYRHCANRLDHGVCNWLLEAADFGRYCRACSMNEVIPNLARPENLILWARLEAAKRRLLYTLLSLALPVEPSGGQSGLRFRFLEDQRRNPEVLEPFVLTGHRAGTITINVAEADNTHLQIVREQMQERYRTLLGHFRHESGHFYFDLLIQEAGRLDEFRRIFGDESADYEIALRRYHESGPRADWPVDHVSAYASAHPHEDWAETFSHYLHIDDALETGREAGLANASPGETPEFIRQWIRLSLTLNELNRSLGTQDAYPFVLTEPVIAKLRFIDRLVHRPDASGPRA